MDTLTVLVRDAEAPKVGSAGFKVIRDPASEAARLATRLFVLVTATRLREVAERVREANRAHHLRGLLVRDDVGANWITVSLADAELRSLRNLVVHSGVEVPRRILNAWRHGAQSRLIADAHMVGNRLLVRACDLATYEVPVDKVRALSMVPSTERGRFEIHPNGSYLHWPGADVHIDLESLRAAVDPVFAERARRERIAHDQRFGHGVRAVREHHRLAQAEIDGVSERQVRRIEAGEFFPRTGTLERLALAHGLSLDEYLSRVSQSAGG